MACSLELTGTDPGWHLRRRSLGHRPGFRLRICFAKRLSNRCRTHTTVSNHMLTSKHPLDRDPPQNASIEFPRSNDLNRSCPECNSTLANVGQYQGLLLLKSPESIWSRRFKRGARRMPAGPCRSLRTAPRFNLGHRVESCLYPDHFLSRLAACFSAAFRRSSIWRCCSFCRSSALRFSSASRRSRSSATRRASASRCDFCCSSN